MYLLEGAEQSGADVTNTSIVFGWVGGVRTTSLSDHYHAPTVAILAQVGATLKA